MWIAEGDTLLGPWRIESARRFDHDTIYAAHVIKDVDGTPALIGFEGGTGHDFGGFILDPVPLAGYAPRSSG